MSYGVAVFYHRIIPIKKNWSNGRKSDKSIGFDQTNHLDPSHQAQGCTALNTLSLSR